MLGGEESLLSESGEDSFDPGITGLVIVDVAVHTGVEASGPEGFQRFIIIFATLTEAVIAGVTKREHGVAQMLQALGGAIHHLLIKILRAIGRIAIAISAGDDQGGIELLQDIRCTVRHVLQHRIVTPLAGDAGGFFRAGFRVSREGAEEDEKRLRHGLLRRDHDSAFPILLLPLDCHEL